MNKSIKVICSFLFLIFISLAFFKPIETGDSWWHLSTVRWMLEHRQFPQQDMFSFTSYKVPWTFTQWLGSSSFYMAYLAGGFFGVKIFRALIFILIIGIFYLSARRSLPFFWTVLLLFVTTLGLETRCLLRPDVYNFLFIQLFLVALFDHQKERNSKYIFFLPLLSILWFNIHQGVFIYATLLFGIFIIAQIVKGINVLFSPKKEPENIRTVLNGAPRALLRRSETFTASQRRASPWFSAKADKLRDLFLVFLGHCLALCVGPKGPEGALYAIQEIFYVRRLRMEDTIVEYAPPGFILSWQGMWFFVLCGLALAAVIFNRKYFYNNFLLFVFTTFYFWYGFRSVVLLIPVYVYLIIEAARYGDFKERWQKMPKAKAFENYLGVFLIAVLAINIMAVTNRKIFYHHHYVPLTALTCTLDNPAPAVGLLDSNHIQGNVFNWDGYGGYLLWAAYPRLKPFIDSRQRDEKLYWDFSYVCADVARYWPEVDSKYHFDIALLKSGAQDKIIRYLASRADWQLISLQGPVVVFVKKNAFDLPSDLKHYQEKLSGEDFSEKKLKEFLSEAPAQNPADFAQDFAHFMQRMVDPPAVYVDLMGEGVTLCHMGYAGAGFNKFLEAAREIKDPRLRNNLLTFFRWLDKLIDRETKGEADRTRKVRDIINTLKDSASF